MKIERNLRTESSRITLQYRLEGKELKFVGRKEGFKFADKEEPE